MHTYLIVTNHGNIPGHASDDGHGIGGDSDNVIEARNDKDAKEQAERDGFCVVAVKAMPASPYGYSSDRLVVVAENVYIV